MTHWFLVANWVDRGSGVCLRRDYTYVRTTTLHPSPVTEVAMTPPHAVSPPTWVIKVSSYVFSFATVIPLHPGSGPKVRLKAVKLKRAPALAVTVSVSVISITPKVTVKLQQPRTSNSPGSVFYGAAYFAHPFSSTVCSVKLYEIEGSAPSSLTYFASSEQTNVSSSRQQWVVVTHSTPGQHTIQARSVTILPPPVATAHLPGIAKMSRSSLTTSVEFAQIECSLRSVVLVRFSPKVFVGLKDPTPSTAGVPLGSSTSGSSALVIFPAVRSFVGLAPVLSGLSVSASAVLLNEQGSKVPCFGAPPVSYGTSGAIASCPYLTVSPTGRDPTKPRPVATAFVLFFSTASNASV